MKLIWLAGLMVVALMLPVAPALGDYRLQLQSGSELVVRHYWEDGEQIKFYRYGGLVGIPRASVEVIEPIVAGPTGLQAAGRGRGVTDETVDNDETLAQGEAFQEQVRKLRSELWLNVRQAASEVKKVEEARSAGNQAAEQDARERLRGLIAEQSELNQQIERLYDGSLPPWWFAIMEDN